MDPLPKEIEEHFAIRMLGEPYAFYDKETNQIIRGWKYEGKMYLEGKPR